MKGNYTILFISHGDFLWKYKNIQYFLYVLNWIDLSRSASRRRAFEQCRRRPLYRKSLLTRRSNCLAARCPIATRVAAPSHSIASLLMLPWYWYWTAISTQNRDRFYWVFPSLFFPESHRRRSSCPPWVTPRTLLKLTKLSCPLSFKIRT